MASQALAELNRELNAKQDNINTILDEARRPDGRYQFTKATAFAHLLDGGRDAVEAENVARDLFLGLEKEADEVHAKFKAQESLEEREKKWKERYDDMKRVQTVHTHANGNGNGYYGNGYQGGQALAPRTLGDFMKQAWPEPHQFTPGSQTAFERTFEKWDFRSLASMGTYEQKLMSTGAGWGPETISIPRWIEFAHRPIQVTELFPVGNTSDYAVMYQEETTSTNAATGVGESGTYPESTIIFTKRTVLVKKVATYIGVTDEQLADVNQVASLLDNRLRFFVNQEFDRQLMVGDGLGDNMQGLINTPGLQTQARGGDPIVDAVYKGVVKCRVTGRSQPNAIVLHPTNMQDVRLMKDANGNYIWGAPSDAGVLRMWGIPIVEADLLTLGTGVVGDFANMSQIWMRMGVEVLTGYINDQFIKGQQAIRATMRACLTVYRPTGFCSVTGL